MILRWWWNMRRLGIEGKCTLRRCWMRNTWTTLVRRNFVALVSLEYKFYHRIQKSEMANALKRMRLGKALWLDDILVEEWKSIGAIGVSRLTKLFNKIIMTRKMLDKWWWSTLAPILKNKRDIQSCNNYIDAPSWWAMEWSCGKRVIEHCLRIVIMVSEKQFAWIYAEISTIVAIYLLRSNRGISIWVL